VLLLFDLNGTITDPAGIGDPWSDPGLGAAALRHAVQTATVDVVSGAYRPFAEHLLGAIEREVALRGLDRGRVGDALERAQALSPFGDAADALDHLRAGGHRLAVLTNSGAGGGEATLRRAGLADRFERILGVDAVRSHKPDPRVYAYALAELEVEPGDVTMVAAHAWDTTGAKRAGMRTAWIARGEGELSAAAEAPDVRAADLHEAARALAPR
jgi:2-haloacid dehalogenase